MFMFLILIVIDGARSKLMDINQDLAVDIQPTLSKVSYIFLEEMTAN
jgi:hypothetical protein